MADPSIIIKSGPHGAGFTVETVPPIDGTDRDFADHRAAYGWASGLRLTHGGKIIDQTEVQHG